MVQAGVHYWEGDEVLGATYLWYAHRLLYQEPNGIMDLLDDLRGQQGKQLDEQLSSGPMMPLAMAGWAVPLVAMLVLLGITQLYLRRRFRRKWNYGLLAATVLMVGIASITALALISQSRLDDGARTVRQVVAARNAGTDTVKASGQNALQKLLTPVCGKGLGRCGATVVQNFDGSGNNDGAGTRPDRSDDPTRDSKLATSRIASATRYSGLGVLIPILAVAVGALVWVGFYDRLNEYRYEPR
jgi:hypothetical protein